MKQYPLPEKDYMVLIRCFTYNHEAYIEDALKGFIMQKTNFSFVAVVVDDASTDGTANIIRRYEAEYPDIIKGIYLKENHYSQKKKKTPYIQPWRDRSKYEALCEGDDYWIDPLKLQKQVDFMESHPDYGMCYGIVRQYIHSKNKFLYRKFGSNIISIESLLINNTIPTLTVLFRKDLLYKYYNEQDIHKNNWLLGDYPLWLFISYHSRIFCFNDIFGVYRILDNSASHNTDMIKQERFINSAYDMRIFFAQKYQIGDIQNIQNERYKTLIFNAIKSGDKKRIKYWYKKLDTINIIFIFKFLYNIIKNISKFL